MHTCNRRNSVTGVTVSQQPTARAYYYAVRQPGPGELIAEGTERECRQAAARALGRETLRGCPTAPSERGTLYFEPGVAYDEAPAVELVTTA